MANIATTTGFNTVRQMLKDNQPKIASMLGEAITKEYFSAAVMNCIGGNAKLLACTEQSLMSALLTAARLRLVPDGVLGHAYLVPYSHTATLIPGYKGIRELVLRTNKYKDLRARVVYAGDYFKFNYGMAETVEHVPSEGTRGAALAVYAVAELADGSGANIEVMRKLEVEAHRDKYAKGLEKADSAWNTAPDRMWEKTVMLRLCRRLPMTVEVQSIFEVEEKMNAGVDLKTGKIIDVEPVKKPDNGGSKLESVTSNLKKRNKENKKDATAAKPTPPAQPVAAASVHNHGTSANALSDVPLELQSESPPEAFDEDEKEVVGAEAAELINNIQVAKFLKKARAEGLSQKVQARFLNQHGFLSVHQITRGKFWHMYEGLGIIQDVYEKEIEK